MITFPVQHAALALLLTLAGWEPRGPNKGRMGRLNAFAPGLLTRQLLCPTATPAQTPETGERLPLPSCHCLWALEASPVARACSLAARSWRSFSYSCSKQDVDATRIPPGCAPSGRPIASTVSHLLLDSRPGPKSGVGCRLTTLLILLHCQVSHGVRVPALSVGAGEGSFFAYPRRLYVSKLNGDQVIDGKREPTHQWNRCVKRSFVRVCNGAIRHGQVQPLYLCTFCYFQIPEECVAADHRYLVPNADRKPAAATYPILGWDGPHWDPDPRMLRDVVWILTQRLYSSQLVSARKLCSGDALRPDLSWVLNYTVFSVPFKGHLQRTGLRGAERGPQCALLGPLLFAGLHHRWSSATFVPVYPLFLQIPEECVAADHRCLVPNADKRAGGGNLPHPGMGWPALGPGPMYASGWVTSRPYRSQLVRARKLCSGDALRPDLPWVMNYTISVCPHGPLAVHRTGCCTWSLVCPPGATAVCKTTLVQ